MALYLGWVGMSLIVVGTYLTGITSQWLFLAGTLVLGVTAILGKSRFYAALQVPIIVGATAPLLPASMRYATHSTVCITAIVAVVYLARSGQLREWQTKVGVLGLLLLSLGFASGQKPYLLPANFTLLFNAAYRLRVKREKVAVVWLALEIFATLGTLYSIWNSP